MLINSRQHLHLADQDASLWGEQCLHPRIVHNKRGGPHSVCSFTSTMPSDCLPSWAKSPAAINQCTSIYIGCSLSSVSAFWFVCFKDTSGSHQCMLAPEVCLCQGKGLKRRQIVDFCLRWVSALPVCSCGGKLVAAGPTLPLWTEGRKEAVERWGLNGDLAQSFCLLN